MLMSKIVGALLIIAVFCGALAGKMPEVAGASLTGARDAVQLLLQIGGTLCLWSALMEIMDRSGLSARFARLLGPIIVLLFGEYGRDSEARQAISQNMAANLLGLGSAATPAGLKAAGRLQALARQRGEPPDAVFLLIVINTASLQLLPTTVAAVRAGLGSAAPYDILPAVWLSSAVSVAVGIFAAKTLRRVWKRL